MSPPMTRAEREAFLAQPRVATLRVSIAEAERGPLAVPVWYLYEPGGDVRVWTGGRSRKARLLLLAGRASLVVQNPQPPYQYVSVEGPITRLEPVQFERDLRPLAQRYLGAEAGERYLASLGGPAAVNATLQELLSGAHAALGDEFVGLYLYGSLASGDFDPATSDIDFVVVTAGALPAERVAALEALHQRLWAEDKRLPGSCCAAHLEGAYVPRAALRRYDPAAAPVPTVNEGRFYLGGFGSDWIIQRHVLREYGVVLAGPPPASLIDPVTPDDLRHAVAGSLRGWWERVVLADPAFLLRPEYQPYAVLTMCRARYAIARGAIVSKPAAARWASAALPERWHTLIQQAAAWQPGNVIGRVEEVQALIRETVAQAQDW